MKTKLLLIIFLLASTTIMAQVISGKSGAKKITVKSKGDVEKKTEPKQSYITALPDLIITGEVFSDENQNNFIDANEYCTIRLNVENIGKGTAEGVVVRTKLKNGEVHGLTYGEDINLGDLGPDTKTAVSIPVRGYVYLEEGFAEFIIEVREDRGFDAFPLEMKIETKPFASPKVVIADAAFSTEDGGLIKLNYPIILKVIVQNVGAGDASGVVAEFKFPKNDCVVLGLESRFAIGKLQSGETKEIDFTFTATRRYTDLEIPILIDMAESYNKYTSDTTLSVSLQQQLTAQNQVVISGSQTEQKQITRASLTSAIDKNIPVHPDKNNYRYALIIGNEDYSRYQRGLESESDVDFARNDAKIFREYAIKTLGVKEDNVYLLQDATAGEMQQKIDLISKLANKTGEKAEIIFYYAGHGLPHEVNHEPYLIPVDVTGTNLAAAIPLKDVYKKLSETGAKRVTIFLDACFSGGGRDAALIAARSVKVKPKSEIIAGNMVVFTASTGEQSALPYDKEQHGLFTYFLLKKLQETKGNIGYGNLAEYISQTVSLESLKINQKEQDPQIQVSFNVENTWKAWNFNE